MRTIVLGDVHGGLNSLKRSLRALGVIDENDNRRDGFRVIQVGDLLNMAPHGQTFRGFVSEDKATLQWVVDTNAIDEVLVGNHELFYTHNVSVGLWQGMALYADQLEKGLLPLIHRATEEGFFLAATEAHGSLITHAGIAHWEEWMGDNPAEIADTLNDTLIDIATHDDTMEAQERKQWRPILGTDNPDSSIFWSRPWVHEGDSPFNQIVGHTPDHDHPRFYHDLNLWVIDNGKYVEGGPIPCLSWDGEGWEALLT